MIIDFLVCKSYVGKYTVSLRKHPFLLALRRRGRFAKRPHRRRARRNGCFRRLVYCIRGKTHKYCKISDHTKTDYCQSLGQKIKLYWNKRGRRKKYPWEGRVGKTIGARPQMTFEMTSVRSYAPEEIIMHESDISPQWLIDMLRSETTNDLWNDKRAILCPRRNNCKLNETYL